MTEMPVQERSPLTAEEKRVINAIRRQRIDLGMKQEELSVALGMNANYMGVVESYRRGISLKTLFKVAKILKVKPGKFFD